MSDLDINEAFKRLARGERFAQAVPVSDEAEAEHPPSPHGSADGGAGYARPALDTPTLNELFRDFLRGDR